MSFGVNSYSTLTPDSKTSHKLQPWFIKSQTSTVVYKVTNLHGGLQRNKTPWWFAKSQITMVFYKVSNIHNNGLPYHGGLQSHKHDRPHKLHFIAFWMKQRVMIST